MILRLQGETHTYTDDHGSIYDISVTDLVKKFRKPFDEVAQSKAYAKKYGHTPEYWIEQWRRKGRNGRAFGNALHKMKQEQLNGSALVKFRNSIRFVQNHNFFERLEDLADGVYAELPMGLSSYKLAGTPDEICIESVLRTRFVDVNDHKTNARIRTVGYSQGAASPKKMLYPINHLDDCEFTHHSLQVSTYAYILEMHGYTPRNLSFTHYEKTPLSGSKPTVYPVEYMKKEVKLMLNTYRPVSHTHLTLPTKSLV